MFKNELNRIMARKNTERWMEKVRASYFKILNYLHLAPYFIFLEKYEVKYKW